MSMDVSASSVSKEGSRSWTLGDTPSCDLDAREASTRLPSERTPMIAATTTTTASSTVSCSHQPSSLVFAHLAGTHSNRQHVSSLSSGTKKQTTYRSTGKHSTTSTSISRASPERHDSPTLVLAGNPLLAARRIHATSPRSSKRSGVELHVATKSRFFPATMA